jgi:hypothetical protein
MGRATVATRECAKMGRLEGQRCLDLAGDFNRHKKSAEVSLQKSAKVSTRCHHLVRLAAASDARV